MVEALLSARASAGIDINPLAHLISKAKTTFVPEHLLREVYAEVQEISQSALSEATPPTDAKLSYWFKEDSLIPLSALAHAVRSIGDRNCQTLFSAILSATARDVMLTYRGEVRLRRLVKRDLDRFKPDPFIAFGKRAKLAIDRVSNLPVDAESDVRLDDAKHLPYPDDSFDAVISSPPYADNTNGVGYFQFSWYMLRWLGWSETDLRNY